MNAKLLLVLSVSVAASLHVGACGQNAPVAPAEGTTIVPSEPLPPTASPTLEPEEGLRLGQWNATADFGSFTFRIEPGMEMVIGTFSFPTGFSCGGTEVTGTSFEVFDVSTTFPPPNAFGAPPPTPEVPIVKVLVSETDFSVGPFWIGLTIPTTRQRFSMLNMTIEGRFYSATEASGQVTADAVVNPETAELRGAVCTGVFTAEWALP